MATPLRFRATDASGEVSTYRELTAHGPASHLVERAWMGRAGWRRQIRVLPDGCADLVWDGRALSIAPARPFARTYDLPANGLSLGLRLRCGVLGGLLGFPADELSNEPLRLAEVWDRVEVVEADLAAATPAQALRRMERLVLDRQAAPDARVTEAVRRLRRPEASVASVAEAVGLTPRDLRRRVRRAVGYGPKTLQRVLRFRRFHRALEAAEGGLAAAALDAGYADQAHLTRECRELTGSTPGQLARRNVQDA